MYFLIENSLKIKMEIIFVLLYQNICIQFIVHYSRYELRAILRILYIYIIF